MADPGRILDSLSTSVLIVDRARAILYLNVAAETLFGTSRNQARGRPLESCSPMPLASMRSSSARWRLRVRSCAASWRCGR